jgi:hypothetical protein
MSWLIADSEQLGELPNSGSRNQDYWSHVLLGSFPRFDKF